MSHATPHPELVNAYKLLKAGKRQEAGQLLKSYLAQNPGDADAWWMMSFAVGKPEQIEQCLRAALKIDPHHEKSRAKLAQLGSAAPVTPDTPATPADTTAPAAPAAALSRAPAASTEHAAPPTPPVVNAKPAIAPPPADAIEEPDERLFFATLRADSGRKPRPRSKVIRPLTAAPATAPQTEAFSMALDELADSAQPIDSAAAISFAEFAAVTYIERDPFSGEPVHDPFASIPLDDDPFTGLDAPLIDLPQTIAIDRPQSSERTGADNLLALVVAVFSILVVGSIVLYALNKGGAISLDIFSNSTAMTELNAATFAIEYPEGWDRRCRYESLGYQVCGIANHALYNDVDWFVDQQVDIGAMISAAFSASFAGSVPDEQISIIVMDVPMNSSSYDNGSWAKTLYEYYQQGWAFEPDAEVTYNGRQDIEIDGYPAYYYKYTSSGRWKDAAWDVYIPHDGIVFWMRATFTGERGDRIPQDTIDDMIDSIDINPQ